jgi:beta-glucosidase
VFSFLINADLFSFSSVAYKQLPTLDYEMFNESDGRGWIGSWHNHVDNDSLIPLDEVLETQLIDESRMFITVSVPQRITRRWTLKVRGHLKPRPYDCTFEFGLQAAGRAKVYIKVHYIYIASDHLLG